jgi:hypothetical protein
LEEELVGVSTRRLLLVGLGVSAGLLELEDDGLGAALTTGAEGTSAEVDEGAEAEVDVDVGVEVDEVRGLHCLLGERL